LHMQMDGKNHGCPFLQCKKPVQWFCRPFRNKNGQR
jgi:hypothetical protein